MMVIMMIKNLQGRKEKVTTVAGSRARTVRMILIMLLLLFAVVGGEAQEDANNEEDKYDTYTISVIPKMKSAFFDEAFQGCQDRAAAFNAGSATAATSTTTTPSSSTVVRIQCLYNYTYEPNPETIIEILDALIDDDTIDAIAVSVLDAELYTPVIDKCVKNGKKPIITFDSDAPNSNRLAYVGTDNYAMGQELAKLLKQIQPTGGYYGIVSGFGENLNQRVRGVRDGLADTPSWKEVNSSPKNGMEDIAISLEKMYELANENKDPAGDGDGGLGAIVSVVGLVSYNCIIQGRKQVDNNVLPTQKKSHVEVVFPFFFFFCVSIFDRVFCSFFLFIYCSRCTILINRIGEISSTVIVMC